ncbi:hypothetical protein Q5752_007105 [Cryptotrichosporon argae]
MATATDTFARADFFPQNQFLARDLAVPKFGRAIDVRGGNAKPIRSVAWSCDGKRIATGTEAKGLRIWDGKNPEASSSFALPHLSKPSPHGSNISALAWSPVDPDVLVSGCKGGAGAGVLAVWDVTSDTAPVATFRPPGDILHITFHPSGRHFAVVCPRSTRDEVYFYWLVERNGKHVWAARDDVMIGGAGVDVGIEEINSLRFSNSGRFLLAVSNDGSLHSWAYPLDTRAPLPDPKNTNSSDTDCRAIAVDEPVVEAGRETNTAGPSREGSVGRDAPEGEVDGSEGALEGGDAEAGEADAEGQQGKESNSEAPRATQADDGEKAVERSAEAAAPADGDVVMADGDAKATDQAHDDPPQADLSPAASAEASTTQPPVSAEAATTNAASVPVSSTPSDKTDDEVAKARKAEAARAAAEHELEKRRHRQLRRVRRHSCASASLLNLSLDPLGRFLAVGGQDAMLSILDTRDWISHQTFDITTAAIRHSAFSPDGELIAIAGDDNFIAIVAIHAGTTIAKLPVPAPVNSIAWSPQSNTLAWSTSSKASVIWYLVRQE